MEARQNMPRHKLHVQELEEPASSVPRRRLSKAITFSLLSGALLALAAIIGPHAISIAQQNVQASMSAPAPAPTAAADARQLFAQQSAPAAKQTPPPRPTTAQKASTPAPAPADTAPRRTETIQYESWTVICQDTLDKSSKRSCAAINRVVEPKTNRVAFVWRMNIDEQGRLIARMQTPTSVRIQRGVEVKLGAADSRRFMFTLCDPRSCLAEAVVEDALLKEALGAPEGIAMVTLSDGRGLQFKWSMKGFDKAMTTLRAQH